MFKETALGELQLYYYRIIVCRVDFCENKIDSLTMENYQLSIINYPLFNIRIPATAIHCRAISA